MKKTAPERYASVTALAEDLQRFQGDQPILARRATSLERTWRWCRRNPVVASLLISIGGLLIVLACGASIAALWLGRERDTAVKAEGQAQHARQAALDQLWEVDAAARREVRRWRT